MADGAVDAVDYGGTSDSDSESDEVPSRLPAPGGIVIWRMILASFMQDSDAHHHRRCGKDGDRRLCRDPLRSPHVTAPPQAVTMTSGPPTMATTTSRVLAHRGDGRRHLPGRSRQQHHASKPSGGPTTARGTEGLKPGLAAADEPNSGVYRPGLRFSG